MSRNKTYTKKGKTYTKGRNFTKHKPIPKVAPPTPQVRQILFKGVGSTFKIKMSPLMVEFNASTHETFESFKRDCIDPTVYTLTRGAGAMYSETEAERIWRKCNEKD